MYIAALFLSASLAIAAQGLSLQSARTLGSSHLESMVPASHYSVQHQSVVPGHVQATHDSHQAFVGDDKTGSMLVCQVVQIPVIQPGTSSAGSPDVAQVFVGAGPAAGVASSVISSSQQALSNLNSRVRTTVDRLVRPVVSALQNASLWLNSTTQNQISQHPHHHQQGHHASVHPHLHLHHAAHATPVQSAHSQNAQDVLPQKAIPMTVVSLPVLVPAVDASSGSPFSSLSNIIRRFQLLDLSSAFQQPAASELSANTSSFAQPVTAVVSNSTDISGPTGVAVDTASFNVSEPPPSTAVTVKGS